MNLREYSEAIRPLMFKGDEQIPLVVAALGLCSEAHEALNASSAKETKLELGDVLWYAAAIAYHYQIDFGLFEEAHSYKSLSRSCGELGDRIKKAEWHDKPLSAVEVALMINDVVGSLRNAAGLSDIAQANVDKLKARWPNGFGVKP